VCVAAIKEMPRFIGKFWRALIPAMRRCVCVYLAHANEAAACSPISEPMHSPPAFSNDFSSRISLSALGPEHKSRSRQQQRRLISYSAAVCHLASLSSRDLFRRFIYYQSSVGRE
jgi:hypothetical protein